MPHTKRKYLQRDDALTISEAARLLRASRSTLYEKVREGAIPTFEEGGRKWIPKAEFDAYVREKTRVVRRRIYSG
jgi:excisionase family DNA binding protein